MTDKKKLWGIAGIVAAVAIVALRRISYSAAVQSRSPYCFPILIF